MHANSTVEWLCACRKYTSAQEQVGDRVQLWVWTWVTQTVITVNVVVGVGCTISYSVFETAPPSTPQTVLALLYSWWLLSTRLRSIYNGLNWEVEQVSNGQPQIPSSGEFTWTANKSPRSLLEVKSVPHPVLHLRTPTKAERTEFHCQLDVCVIVERCEPSLA